MPLHEREWTEKRDMSGVHEACQGMSVSGQVYQEEETACMADRGMKVAEMFLLTFFFMLLEGRAFKR
jgi:hypothetical protein